MLANMKKRICIIAAACVALAGLSLSGCIKENLIPSVIPDGNARVTLGFDFEALNAALSTRGVNGSLDFVINDLVVLFYKASGDSEDGKLLYAFEFTRPEMKLEKRTPAHCEETTYHGNVSLDVPYGDYRIYAAANVKDLMENKYGWGVRDDGTFSYELSEKQLREIQIPWPEEYSSEAGSDKPASFGVPDAMFGYFTREGVTDHTKEEYRNVIYHNRDLYPWEKENFDFNHTDHTDVNLAKAVTIDKNNLEVQAWLKRVVSKLTVGFDGSALNPGVEIYVKSVQIVDAASSCLLGHDNSVGVANNTDTEISFVKAETASKDPRLFIEYSTKDGADDAEAAITRDNPAFPRASERVQTRKENGSWNESWYDYVHGSLSNTNPQYNGTQLTLYFMENMQGVAKGTPKQMTKDGVAHFASEEHAKEEAPEACIYYKDGKPYGTYVEVKAYYQNTYFGKETAGEITYRFMLGKNTDNDFNAERNCHYKLILSFVGDANNVDWHIDYQEEEQNPFFSIPTEEQWEKSWVWHAYNDAGEPVAEMCKELIYYKEEDMETEVIPGGGARPNMKYYQVVTVYPVKKDYNKEGNEYQYTTDLSRGKIAQVLKCADKANLEDSDLKAGGDINILLRTQGRTDLWEGDRGSAHAGHYAIRSVTDGKHDNYYYVELLSNDYVIETNNTIMMKLHPKGQYTGNYEPYDLENKTGSNKKIFNLLLGEKQQVEWRIRPYYVQDADGNNYPVVKIGASYWSRKNLKTTTYFNTAADGSHTPNGSKIYPYQGPKTTQTYQYRTADNDITTVSIEGVGDKGYDYDFGPHGITEGYVGFYERYPMYKVCDGEILYNYFAASGTRGQILDDGTETFKKDCETKYGVDPAYHPIDYYWGVDQGFIDGKYLNFHDEIFEFDTAEPYEFNYYEDPDLYNKSLAPKNWHALVTEETVYPGNFGELESDQDYLETFSNYNYEHMIKADGFSGWQWPASKTGMVNRGLAGLDLIPIPYDWEDNKIDIICPVFAKKNGTYDSSHGKTFGFWSETISDEFAYDNSWDMTYELYPITAMFCEDNEHGGLVRELFNQSRQFNLDLPKAYLPMRYVRNAYDYSVSKIEDRKTDNSLYGK